MELTLNVLEHESISVVRVMCRSYLSRSRDSPHQVAFFPVRKNLINVASYPQHGKKKPKIKNRPSLLPEVDEQPEGPGRTRAKQCLGKSNFTSSLMVYSSRLSPTLDSG